MDNRKCIVMLYAKGVQDSAMLAVEEQIKLNYSKAVYLCPVSDDEVSPWRYSKIRRRSYIFASRNAPIFNKVSFYMRHLGVNGKIKKTKKEFKEHKRRTRGLAGWIYRIGAKYRRVYNALFRFEPDLVLCSTPELLSKAVKAKHDLGQTHMSVCALITDYHLDKLFVHYKADGYFVQNDSIKVNLAEYGIEEDIISVIGTPLATVAMTVYDKDVVLQEYDIAKDKPNIVIIGGRYGNAYIKEVFSKVLEVSGEYNIILVTGESDSIGKYCTYAATSKKKAEEFSDNIYIVDKVEEMAKIYAIADIIIASPTAQITYEAIFHSKKLIVLKGGDKQDNLNAHYLTSNNLALRGTTPDEVMASIYKYYEDADFCEMIRKEQSDFAQKDSAREVSTLLGAACQIHYDSKLEIASKRAEVQAEIASAVTEKPTVKRVNFNAQQAKKNRGIKRIGMDSSPTSSAISSENEGIEEVEDVDYEIGEGGDDARDVIGEFIAASRGEDTGIGEKKETDND